MTTTAKKRLTAEDVRVGDVLQWTDGLGNAVTETVFLSQRTRRLAVASFMGGETSVWSLLQIDNNCKIVDHAAPIDFEELAFNAVKADAFILDFINEFKHSGDRERARYEFKRAQSILKEVQS